MAKFGFCVPLLGLLWMAVFASTQDERLKRTGSVPLDKSSDSAVASIGLTLVPIDNEIRVFFRDIGLLVPRDAPWIVAGVVPGGPGYGAGVRKMDLVVLNNGGTAILDPEALVSYFESLQTGNDTSIVLCRASPQGGGASRRLVWKRTPLRLKVASREQIARNRLRFEYYQVYSSWIKLPELELSWPSDQVPNFLGSDDRLFHYESKSGRRSSSKQGARTGERDVTQEVWEAQRASNDETISAYTIGSFGRPRSLKVVQVLNSNEAIVDASEEWVWLYGFSTHGWTDGILLSSPPRIVVVTTKRYDTVSGGTKTLPFAIPLDDVRHGLTDQGLDELLIFLRNGKK